MSAPSRIVILGAGIGGLTAALALRRRGLEAQVFERAPQLAEVGAGIWMPPNAMQVFERLGVDREVVARSVALERVEVGLAEGGVLQQVDLAAARRETGFTIQSIHRATLQGLLADAWGRASISFGYECSAVREVQGRGELTFTNGERVTADVVVGADGLRSRVREHVAPGVELRDARQACFRGIAQLELPDAEGRVCRETWGVGRRFGTSSIGPGQVYWFAPVDQPCALEAREAKDGLLRLFDGFPPRVLELLRATPAEAILRTDLFDIPPQAAWHRGPFVLLGDAAHATTPNLGQGAAQACESAYVLARSLATCGTPADAFADYQRRRLAKAHHVTNTSWQVGQLAHVSGALPRAVRDLALRAVPDAVQARQVERLYSLDY